MADQLPELKRYKYRGSFQPVEIGVSHRVAIDRGIIEGRQVHGSDEIGRQDPAGRRPQGDDLGLGYGGDPLIDDAFRFVDREQRT